MGCLAWGREGEGEVMKGKDALFPEFNHLLYVSDSSLHCMVQRVKADIPAQ